MYSVRSFIKEIQKELVELSKNTLFIIFFTVVVSSITSAFLQNYLAQKAIVGQPADALGLVLTAVFYAGLSIFVVGSFFVVLAMVVIAINSFIDYATLSKTTKKKK